MMNALEPLRYMRCEMHRPTKLCTDFALVDMIGQTVGDDVIPQVLNIVFRRRLRARAAVPADPEDRGCDLRGDVRE